MSISDEIQKIINKPSLYPDLPRKTTGQRKNDLYGWFEKYNEINTNYNLYGLDCVDYRNPDDFLDNGVFKSQRYKVNSGFIPFGSLYSYDYTVLLRDKRLFDSYFRRLIPDGIAPTYGFIINGVFIPTDYSYGMDAADFAIKHDGEHLAIKQTFGCHGVNLISCYIKKGKIEYKGEILSPETFFASISKVNGSMWVIQSWLSQHPILEKFNPTSINTLRIVSYNTGDRVVISKASLLVGPEGSIINNPEAGTETLYGISLDGRVSEYAFSFSKEKRWKSEYGGIVLPNFSTACSLVIKAHSVLHEVFSVGWDVVITNEGAILLEGNDGWSPRATQFPNQEGERPFWESLLKERLECLEEGK